MRVPGGCVCVCVCVCVCECVRLWTVPEPSCSQIHVRRWYKACRCSAVINLLVWRDGEEEGEGGACFFPSLLMSIGQPEVKGEKVPGWHFVRRRVRVNFSKQISKRCKKKGGLVCLYFQNWDCWLFFCANAAQFSFSLFAASAELTTLCPLSVCVSAATQQRLVGRTSRSAAKASASTFWRRLQSMSSSPMTCTW